MSDQNNENRSPPTGHGPLPSDSGLGVPPFRPAPPKEGPSMSRPPFTPTPASPSPNAPGAPMTAARPAAARPMRDPTERRTLVVGRGISVQGTVQDAERLVVEGTFEASMVHSTELSITHGGVFKGEIEVEEAEIAGTIDGTLTARASLIVRSSGKVLGTARCRRLQVEDGGQITGRIEMITDQTPSDLPPRPVVESVA
jgi:cytoskeletal protein CcmA (bactofilin family)